MIYRFNTVPFLKLLSVSGTITFLSLFFTFDVFADSLSVTADSSQNSFAAKDASSKKVGLFRYVDEQGTVHFVDAESKIPEQYREKADDNINLPKLSTGSWRYRARRNKPSYPSRPGFANFKTGNNQGSLSSDSRSKSVEIYVTSNCPHCKRLVQYLRENQISYRKYDVQRSKTGQRRYVQLGGGGVPIVKVGNTVIRGFNPYSIEQALRN